MLLLVVVTHPAGLVLAATAHDGVVGTGALTGTGTIVSLTFDDGSASHPGVGSMLAAHGLTGTFYINSGMIGSSSYYMTWPQVDALAAAGNEITGHTLTHVNLTKVSATTAQQEVCDDRQALLGRGFTPVASFAYPYAANDASTADIVRGCDYTNARDVGGINSGTICSDCPYAETMPPRDPFALRTPEGSVSTTTLQDLETYVLNAESHGGGWVPLVFHGVCDNSCTSTNSTGTAIFAAFLDWLAPRASNGTVVRTVGQVMGAIPVSGPTTTAQCDGAACSTGWYVTSPVTVSLTATDPSATIVSTHYTTDRTDPRSSGTAVTYAGPFTVSATTSVRFSSQNTDGVVETPKSVDVRIDTSAPGVSLTQPADGATIVRNNHTTLTATATDGGSGMASVTFFVDGKVLATVSGTGPTYSTSWNTRKVSGSHVLTARATDVAGNTANSAPHTVRVVR